VSTLTIRLPPEKYERLKQLARARDVSMNKLVEELATVALAEFDAEVRFRTMAARADPEAALRILDALDAREHG
jgi:predicted transcriptional regulator